MIAIKHAEITNVLRQRIESGFYGEKIPSIAQLSKEFEVNPITLRKALGTLEREQVIERKTRIGTFVKRKQRIAFITHAPVTHVEGMFYTDMIRGIQRELDGTSALEFYSSDDLCTKNFARKLINQVDGCIIHPYCADKFEQLLPDMPHVFVIGVPHPERSRKQVFFSYDNRLVGKLIAEYLYGCGARNLIYFGRDTTPVDRERLDAFITATEVLALPFSMVNCDISKHSQAEIFELAKTELADRIIAGRDCRQGLYLSADSFAPLVYQGLYSRGLTPRRDFDLVSVNHNPFYLSQVYPPPPTVDIKMFDIGCQAAACLLKLINQDPVKPGVVLLKPELVTHPLTCPQSPWDLAKFGPKFKI